MKKTLALIVLCLTTSVKAHNFDLDFPCKKILETEVARRFARSERLENIGWGFAVSMVGMPIGLSIIGASDRQVSKGWRIKSIMRALSVAYLNREEVLAVMREEALPKVLEARKDRLIRLNEDRAWQGLPALTVAEYDVRFPVVEELPQLIDKNAIDHLVDTLNEFTKRKLTYEQLQNFLQVERQSNYFCPGDEAPEPDRSFMKQLVADILELSSL